MDKHSEEEKTNLAEYFQSNWRMEFRPVGMTKRKTAKALKDRWNDDYFWFNVSTRYGFHGDNAKYVDQHALESAATTFWAMLREQANK